MIVKALVKSRPEPGLWLDEIETPTIGINDVLIRVLRTGICGTDVHIYKWDEWAQATIQVPMAIGHEFVGRIVEVGSNVADFFPGDTVSGEGHVVCGRCRNCLAGRRHLCAKARGVGVNRAGAFAEYIALPMANIWRHHESVPLDVAAIFDPFGNAVHTALSFPVLGEDVLITGAGPIGIMAAAVARHAGARYTVITDINPYRLELARKLGVTLAVDALAPVIGILLTCLITLPAAGFGTALALFAGFFLYIGASDLIPESYHAHPKFLTTAMTLVGAMVLYLAIALLRQ